MAARKTKKQASIRSEAVVLRGLAGEPDGRIWIRQNTTLMPMIRGFCVDRPAELIKTSECTPERAFGALDQASIDLLPMISGFLRDLPAPGRTGDAW